MSKNTVRYGLKNSVRKQIMLRVVQCNDQLRFVMVNFKLSVNFNTEVSVFPQRLRNQVRPMQESLDEWGSGNRHLVHTCLRVFSRPQR